MGNRLLFREKYRRVSVMFLKRCIYSSKCRLYKLRLRTFCRIFLEKSKVSLLDIVYIKKDSISSDDLGPSSSNSSSTVFCFRKGLANPKDERYFRLTSTKQNGEWLAGKNPI
jgi:hypothetical protein